MKALFEATGIEIKSNDIAGLPTDQQTRAYSCIYTANTVEKVTAIKRNFVFRQDVHYCVLFDDSPRGLAAVREAADPKIHAIRALPCFTFPVVLCNRIVNTLTQPSATVNVEPTPSLQFS